MTIVSGSPPSTLSEVPNVSSNDTDYNEDLKKVVQINIDARSLVDMPLQQLKMVSSQLESMSDTVSEKIAGKVSENLLKKRRIVQVRKLRQFKKDDTIVDKLDSKTQIAFKKERGKAEDMNTKFNIYNEKMVHMMKSVVHLEHEYERAKKMTTKWIKRRNKFRKELTESRVNYKEVRQVLKGIKKDTNEQIKTYNKIRRKTIRDAIVQRTKRSIQARLSRSRRLIKEAQDAERKVLEELARMDA